MCKRAGGVTLLLVLVVVAAVADQPTDESCDFCVPYLCPFCTPAPSHLEPDLSFERMPVDRYLPAVRDNGETLPPYFWLYPGTPPRILSYPVPLRLAEPGLPPVAPDVTEPIEPTVADLLEVDRRWPSFVRETDSVIAERQVIAYYGHPNSRFMGILGENDLDTMTAQLRARAAQYDEINGEIGVAPAFHIIYGTVYEDASVGILSTARTIEYIEYALENDLIVFLDHQIGDGTVEDAVEMMLPFLRYENVHLAFDPEWATDRPGQVIGQVDAAEINRAQQMIQDYLIANDIPGTRMLVVHQFNWRMIENRPLVRSDFERVHLIHHADGFGNPADKRASWQFNVRAENIPLKGFKLFYPKSWRSGGYDVPLMTPEEVMSLEPVPVYVQYQ